MTSRNSIVENLRWLAIPGLVLKPLWFVFLLWSSRALGPAEFGRVMLAVSFVSIVAVLLEGGLDILLVRRLADRPEEAPTLLGRTLPVKLAVGVVTILSAVGATMIWPAAGPGVALALVGALVVALGQFNMHLRAVFRAFEQMRGDALSSMIEKVLTVGLCGALLMLAPSAMGYLGAQAVALLVTVIVTLVLVVRLAGRPRWRIDGSGLWRDVLRPALPFALMNIFTIIYFRSGTLVLSSITGSVDQVGYFNAGYRLVEAYMFLPAIIVTPLYPVFVRTVSDSASVAWRLSEGTRAVLFLTVLTSGLLSLYPAEATRLFFGEAYAPAARSVAILSLAMFPIGMTFVFGTLVAAAGRQGRANWWILVITILNVVGNILFIRWIGLDGAAWTTLITEGLLAAVNLYVVRDYVPWKALVSLLPRVAAALVAGYLAARWMRQVPIAFPWNAAATGGILLLMMLLTGVVRGNDLPRLLGRR